MSNYYDVYKWSIYMNCYLCFWFLLQTVNVTSQGLWAVLQSVHRWVKPSLNVVYYFLFIFRILSFYPEEVNMQYIYICTEGQKFKSTMKYFVDDVT